MRSSARICMFAAILGFAIGGPLASADIVNLTSGNSSLQIDTSFGAQNWVVDGVNNLFQQWFYYRTPGTSNTQPGINNISAPVINQLAPNVASVSFSNAELSVTVFYTLLGGNAGTFTSDIGEVIQINNTSGAPLPLSFFQYCDFDLNGAQGGQVVVIDPQLDDATQFGNGTELSETGIVPAANRAEANLFRNTLNSLETVAGYNLDNTLSAGPGDVTWAFQWDRTLAAGGTLLISKDKQLTPAVPAPAALLLGAAGLSLVGWMKRRLS